MPISNLVSTVNGITVNGHSIAITDDDANNWYITTNTFTYNNRLTYADNAKYWCRTIAEKHFNCPFCGAPNQIDVCEYCGSAYEGE